MNKVSKYARGAVVAAALASPMAGAQDSGDDVPSTPWGNPEECYVDFQRNAEHMATNVGIEGVPVEQPDCQVYAGRMKTDYCREVMEAQDFRSYAAKRKAVLQDDLLPGCELYLPTEQQALEFECTDLYGRLDDRNGSVSQLIMSVSSRNSDCEDLARQMATSDCVEDLDSNYQRVPLDRALSELREGCQSLVQDRVLEIKGQEQSLVQMAIGGCVDSFYEQFERSGAEPDVIISTQLRRECSNYRAEIKAEVAHRSAQDLLDDEGLAPVTDAQAEAGQAYVDNARALEEQVLGTLSTNPTPFGEGTQADLALPEAGSTWDGLADDYEPITGEDIVIGDDRPESTTYEVPSSRTQVVSDLQESYRAEAAVAQSTEPVVIGSDIDVGEFEIGEPSQGPVYDVTKNVIPFEDFCVDRFNSLRRPTLDRLKKGIGDKGERCQGYWLELGGESFVDQPISVNGCVDLWNFYSERGLGSGQINSLVLEGCKLDALVSADAGAIQQITGEMQTRDGVYGSFRTSNGYGEGDLPELEIRGESSVEERFVTPVRPEADPDDLLQPFLDSQRFTQIDLDVGYRGLIQYGLSREEMVDMSDLLGHGPIARVEAYLPFAKEGFVFLDLDQASLTFMNYQDPLRSSRVIDVDGSVLVGTEQHNFTLAGGLMSSGKHSWRFADEDMSTTGSYSIGPAARFGLGFEDKRKLRPVVDLFASYALNLDMVGFDYTKLGVGHLRLGAETNLFMLLDSANINFGFQYDNRNILTTIPGTNVEVNLGSQDLTASAQLDVELGNNLRLSPEANWRFSRTEQEGYNGRNDWNSSLEFLLSVGGEWDSVGKKRKIRRALRSDIGEMPEDLIDLPSDLEDFEGDITEE